jgi:hypothetical protein
VYSGLIFSDRKGYRLAIIAAALVVQPFLLLGNTSPVQAVAPITDFNGDGFEDLAIGVPGEGVGSTISAGAVNVIYGSASGLSATTIPDQIWTQDSANVDDFSESGDSFGILDRKLE